MATSPCQVRAMNLLRIDLQESGHYCRLYGEFLP